MMTTSHGLEFARGILEKYGWKEGKGLGRYEHGMVAALQPKLKNDTAGVGYAQAQAGQFSSCWWERAYNSAAKDISITEGKSGVEVKKKSSDCTKAWNALPLKTYEIQSYNSFVKTSKLTEQGEESVIDETKCTQVEENECEVSESSCLMDDAIFKACGKRTVHKGARHGLKLSGKLARLARQEEQLVSKLPGLQGKVNNCSLPEGSEKDRNINTNDNFVSKKKKKKRRKKDAESYSLDAQSGTTSPSKVEDERRCTKNNRRKKYQELCSETVCEEETPVTMSKIKSKFKKSDSLKKEVKRKSM